MASRISPSQRNAGSGRTKYSDAEIAATPHVCQRRLRTVRPVRSAFWPRTGAIAATRSPARAVDNDSDCEVKLVGPNDSDVR